MYMIKYSACALLLLYFCSCKKEQPQSPFGTVEYQPILLRDSIISHGGNELKIHIDFVSLDSGYVEYPLLQGNVDASLIQITPPTTSDYSFAVDNFQINTTEAADNYSALILLDKTSGNYSFDECISYWIKHMQENNEVAFGGFSDSHGSEGYKIYGNGFVNENSSNKFDGLFDVYSAPLNGNANPLQAAYNALDYLDQNGLNENKNLILFCFKDIEDDDLIVTDLVAKANAMNIKISFIGLHNYDFTEVSQKTGGFHCHFYQSIRTVAFSIDKILTHNYYTSSLDLTITNLVGGSFNSVPQFGYFLYLKKANNDLSKKLYYHVFD